MIAVILLLNAGLGLWQEHKAESALAQLAAPQTWVVRDGEHVRVVAAELVAGDVVRLEARGHVSD